MISCEFVLNKELDIGAVKGQHCTSPILDLARVDHPWSYRFSPQDAMTAGARFATSVCNWLRETTPSFGKIRYK
jgi:hypothetical protein